MVFRKAPLMIAGATTHDTPHDELSKNLVCQRCANSADLVKFNTEPLDDEPTLKPNNPNVFLLSHGLSLTPMNTPRTHS